MRRSASRLAIVALVVGLPAQVAATSMVYQRSGPGSLVQVAVIGVGPEWAARTLLAGDDVKWVSPDRSPQSTPYDPTFYNYSLELWATSLAKASIAAWSTNLLPVSGVPDSSGKAAWLFNSFGPGVRTEAYSPTDERAQAEQNAAALQLAVWETMLDSSGDLSSGTFDFNTAGAVRTKAVEYLSTLSAGGPWLGTERRQDAIALPGIPEPASWLMLGSGIVGLVALAYRRSRTAPRN